MVPSEHFEDFLQTFKTAPQKSQGLAGALGDMNIDEDDFSDEYDFMDDDDEEAQNARLQARKHAKGPKTKYLDLLQKVANRYEDEINIDLDDLAKVGHSSRTWSRQILTVAIVRASLTREWHPCESGRSN